MIDSPTKTVNSYPPGVMSMIPLYYVAWADNVLSPSEIKTVRKKIDELPFLTFADKRILARWSNPSRPPAQQTFRHWSSIMRETLSTMPENQVASLAALGIEMARLSAGNDTQKLWSAPDTHQALYDLEVFLKGGEDVSVKDPFERHREALIPDTTDQIDTGLLKSSLESLDEKTQDRLRKILQDQFFDLDIPAKKEDYRKLVLDWTMALAKQGMGNLSYPAIADGGEDMRAYIALFETLGYHDLSLAIKFGVQFGLFGGSVYWLGTEMHHKKYLKPAGKGHLLGCFAMTETGHGSNVRGLQTTATYDPETETIVVNSPNEAAGKEYIGNALHSRMASVFCQLIVNGENHGVHAVLVPLRDGDGQELPGIRVKDCGYKMGLNGVDNGRIWFDEVRVPKENLLNRFGDIDEKGNYTSPIENPSKRFFTMLGTLVGGRVCVPKAGLSATKVALTIAIRYALQRRQFAAADDLPETLLLDYPHHQYRLMPLLAKTYALNYGLNYLAERYLNRTENDIREIESLAAGMKAYSTWFTTHAIQMTREACGGKGYLAENRIATLKGDTDIFTTFEGDNTVLMQLVAKGLLSNFRRAFHDEGIWAVMRYMRNQISTSITELNPITIRNTDPAHLLDAKFHLSAFRYRERKLLISVSQRMRSLIKGGMNSYDAYLRCQNHIMALAEAFVERVVLEQFTDAVDQTTHKPNQNALRLLQQLYALHTIEGHKGWYLEADYMSSGKTKAIRREVKSLCTKLREHALPLTDAFAIPENCIAAPIAVLS